MYIYKTTNLLNNKIYIGQSTRQFSESYLGSGTRIQFSIKKHGKSNFKVEIIDFCNNQDELNEMEQYWIEYYNSTNNEIGYNITSGGQQGGHGWSSGLTKNDHVGLALMAQKASERTGWNHSDETKDKQSKSAKGRYTLEWFIERYGEEIGYLKFETRNKDISNRMIGNIPWNKGKPHDIANRPDVRIKLEEYWETIRGKSFEEIYGDEIGNQIREKMSNARKGISFVERFGEEKAREILNRRGKSKHENSLKKKGLL